MVTKKQAWKERVRQILAEDARRALPVREPPPKIDPRDYFKVGDEFKDTMYPREILVVETVDAKEIRAWCYATRYKERYKLYTCASTFTVMNLSWMLHYQRIITPTGELWRKL